MAVCVCGMILAMTYIALDKQNWTTLLSARPGPSPIRRPTTTPARLEFINPRAMTSDDYGAVPIVAKQAARFFLPSLEGQGCGHIYSFATAKDSETFQQYCSAQGGTPPHILIKDNILVRIHGNSSQNLASQYQNVLNTLG